MWYEKFLGIGGILFIILCALLMYRTVLDHSMRWNALVFPGMRFFSAALVYNLLFINNHDFEYLPNYVLLFRVTLLCVLHLNRILKSVCFPRVFLAPTTSENLKGTCVIKILHIHFEFINIVSLILCLNWRMRPYQKKTW